MYIDLIHIGYEISGIDSKVKWKNWGYIILPPLQRGYNKEMRDIVDMQSHCCAAIIRASRRILGIQNTWKSNTSEYY